MKTCTVSYEEHLLACAVRTADTFGSRFLGLMGRKSLESGEGLLLRNCPQVHCCFMRFPIDVVYLDAEDAVLETETIAPWHFGKRVKHAAHVLELEAGKAAGIPPGEKLQICEI